MAFANSPVIVERVSPVEVRIIKARLISEDEAWLWKNETTLKMVRRGLQQARNGRFVEDVPDSNLGD
jgi:hypothetical protein